MKKILALVLAFALMTPALALAKDTRHDRGDRDRSYRHERPGRHYGYDRPGRFYGYDRDDRDRDRDRYRDRRMDGDGMMWFRHRDGRMFRHHYRGFYNWPNWNRYYERHRHEFRDGFYHRDRDGHLMFSFMGPMGQWFSFGVGSH